VRGRGRGRGWGRGRGRPPGWAKGQTVKTAVMSGSSTVSMAERL
jgi:hypothetical protein